jgi:hypothetical protein
MILAPLEDADQFLPQSCPFDDDALQQLFPKYSMAQPLAGSAEQ